MKKYYLHAAWAISLCAVIVSLYFSEILKLAPCVLCWWQRVLIYPLAIIIPVGLFNNDKNVHKYILPFSILGTIIATYHYLLTMGIIPANLAPCQAGVSCITNYILWFGFINIPLMSFAAFTMITLLMIIYSKTKENE